MKKNNEIYLDSPTVISDFIENLLLNDFDFKNHSELYNIVWYILESGGLIKKDHLEYLDFDVYVSDDDGEIRIVGNNIVTSLWFSNIFPVNPDECYIKNTYEDDKNFYSYNKNEKKLLISKNK